jgi:transposase-like protein
MMLALAEMYVQGGSTHKVAAISKRLCGSEISSTQVSRSVALLGEVLEAGRNRPLGTIILLYLDALYEKVRFDVQIRGATVLIASRVNLDGKRLFLGVSDSLNEQELHWRGFLQSLVERGLIGIELIISDAHVGLLAAHKAVFSGIPWQRCQFHLQQNASQNGSHQSMKQNLFIIIKLLKN